MDDAWDEFALESIADLHGIEARPFIPFAIARLAPDPATMEARLAVQLRGLRDAASVERRQLRLTWAPASVPRSPPGMQDNPVTEWAAVAVAVELWDDDAVAPNAPRRSSGDRSMTHLDERITVDPKQCGGRPCVRGMRIRVSDVLDLMASGLSAQQVVEELPDLEPADVAACLRFAGRRLGRPVLVA